MRIEDLADRAVALKQRQPGMKLSEAVSQVAEGQGLNAEGLHRLSTMANRKYLVSDQRSKQSNGTPLWTSRWPTSKPNELQKTSSDDAYNARTTTPEGGDPGKDAKRGSMGSAGSSTEDAIDYQLNSIRDSADNANDMTDPDDDEKTQPASFEQVTQFSAKASSSGPRYTDVWEPSTEETFAKLASVIRTPQNRKAQADFQKVSTVRAETDRSVNVLESEYETMKASAESLSVLVTKTSFDAHTAQLVLDAAVQEAVGAGLTVGEALQFVKLAGRHEGLMGDLHSDKRVDGWYLSYIGEALPKLGVDPEAALGNSYDGEGYKRSSHVARNQAQIRIRSEILPHPEDPLSIEDTGAPLVQAAASYFHAKESQQVAEVALKYAKQSLREMDSGLAEAYSLRRGIYELPSQTLIERL